ncbi:MAG: hypothetical protein AAF821_20745 [Cyanobacteria bacterium P01_D01_bin.156]
MENAQWLGINVLRPLVMVILIVVLGTTNPEVPHISSQSQPSSVHIQQQESLPLTRQIRARFRKHQRVTIANMTDHKLTTAHLFSRRSVGKLSSDVVQRNKRG